MNIFLFQAINYTLSFFMWMIIGRVIVTLLTGGGQNFITGLFQKITDPVYRVVRMIVPFADVPQDKQGTMWWKIGGCMPFFSIFFIIVIRIALIIAFTPPPMK
jgi:hypothetical protein